VINTLHIGDNIVIGAKDIIGIFDITPENSELLKGMKENFSARNATGQDKSFVFVKRKKELIYFSRITGRNLMKRMRNTQEEGNGKKSKKEK